MVRPIVSAEVHNLLHALSPDKNYKSEMIRIIETWFTVLWLVLINKLSQLMHHIMHSCQQERASDCENFDIKYAFLIENAFIHLWFSILNMSFATTTHFEWASCHFRVCSEEEFLVKFRCVCCNVFYLWEKITFSLNYV